MKCFDIKPDKIFSVEDNRMDVNFWNVYKEEPEKYIEFLDLFEILPDKKPDFNQLAEEINYCQIGDVNNDGEVFPTVLYMRNKDDDEDDDSKIYKKIFGDKRDRCQNIMCVDLDDILIAKTRPLLNKIVYIRDKEYLNYYYTTDFIRVRSKDESVSPVMAYYVLREMLNKQIVSISRIGKSGYPAIGEDDLKYIKIPISIESLKNKKLNDIIQNNYRELVNIKSKLLENQKEHQTVIRSTMNSLISK